MRVGVEKIVMKVMSGHVRGRIVSLTVSVVIIGLMVLPGCGLATAPIIGHNAPDFILTGLDGNTVPCRDAGDGTALPGVP